jgi:sec-independent protein translocase protein TatB
MFSFLSWGHLLVLALGAFFIFGPERLPTLARDAAQGLKRFRAAVSEMRGAIGSEMGEDFAQLRDLDLRRYHPRTFLHEQLFGDEPSGPVTFMGQPDSSAPGIGPPGVLGVARPAELPNQVRQPSRTLPPPFDVDAT